MNANGDIIIDAQQLPRERAASRKRVHFMRMRFSGWPNFGLVLTAALAVRLTHGHFCFS